MSKTETVAPASVRDVAGLARAYATEVGLPKDYGYGSRGRLGANVYLAFLETQAPKSVREIGQIVGITIAPKAKVSDEKRAEVAIALATNAAKRSAE
jgi:hypothetical protein